MQVDLAGVHVAIGMPCDTAVPMKTMMSVAATVQRCMEMGVLLSIETADCGVIQIARDMVLNQFLRGKADKLFWIDSDMVWGADDFMQMVARSTQVECVGGAYLRKLDGPDFWFINAGKEIAPSEIGLFPVDGLGLGYTIVDRKVIQKLADAAPKVRDPLNNDQEMAAVFRVDTVNGLRRSEDMAFFADIKSAGYQVWLDPAVTLGHIGVREWRGRLLDTLSNFKSPKE